MAHADSGLSARIVRDPSSGIASVVADSEAAVMEGLGYLHARDRGLQMLLMRILGRGTACQHLDGSDATLAIDLFFRRMNWGAGCAAEVEKLGVRDRERAEAYCDGVNRRFLVERKLPWEFRAMGYKPDAWTPEDCILIARMTGYLTLAQSQGEMERLLVQLVQAGVERPALDELFPGILGGLDLELLKKVRLGERMVPDSVKWNGALPRMMASNNWVVSGAHTGSGAPFLCNDPHLETNRLPNVWYEVSLSCSGSTGGESKRWGTGASMPGLPGLLVGRTSDLAWGATYAFMDAIDSWVEECKDGKYRRGQEWKPFHAREEVILRKGANPHRVTFFENEHGVLDGDPAQEGFLLATRWSGAEAGARSLEGMSAIWDARTVEEGRKALGRLEVAFSWVLADVKGDIGFQMSGLLPLRKEGWDGFVPVPGWDPANDWKGFASAEELPRAINPLSGFFCTANHDLNSFGSRRAITMPMGDYRARRISEVLGRAGERRFRLEDMQALQMDVLSTQARDFLPLLKPFLPDSPAGRLLSGWDLKYDTDSLGASLFEDVYAALLSETFGRALGDAYSFLKAETGTFVDFYHCFDRVLLSERSAWFGGRTRDEVFRAAVSRVFGGAGPRLQRWGDRNRLTMSHILLGGKLPRFLGFDRGPMEIRGGRATPHQGQIYRSAGRATSFTPSFRMVTDLSESAIHTCSAGGPSDRRFSPLYLRGLRDWQLGRFKRVSATQA